MVRPSVQACALFRLTYASATCTAGLRCRSVVAVGGDGPVPVAGGIVDGGRTPTRARRALYDALPTGRVDVARLRRSLAAVPLRDWSWPLPSPAGCGPTPHHTTPHHSGFWTTPTGEARTSTLPFPAGRLGDLRAGDRPEFLDRAAGRTTAGAGRRCRHRHRRSDVRVHRAADRGRLEGRRPGDSVVWWTPATTCAGWPSC